MLKKVLKKTAILVILSAFLYPAYALAFTGGRPGTGEIQSSIGIVTGRTLCSGVKVSTRKILTARHCVDGILSKGHQVELLTTQGYSPGASTLVAQVTEIWTAPADGSRRDWAPDVALIEVNQDLRLWSPAKISYANIREGERLWVGGHGCKGANVSDTHYTYTGEYRKPLTDKEPGIVEFEAHNASYSNSTFCQGDSGGPVLRKFAGREIVVGVNKTTRTAEKIYSESNELIQWLEILLPLSTFTWD